MAHLSRLLTLVNKLQQACTLVGDNSAAAHAGGTPADSLPGLWEVLPQIVAIGGQSAGKSSVVEAIVGRDILPRSAGICTRRPLVLQLSQAPPGSKETAQFLHAKGRVIDISESAEAVRDEIEAETTRSLGGGKAVSPEPIMLTISSPRVPNLTLVDMPGLTKIATDGQPASIVRELEEMSRAYIRPKNVIILAISPANADIATSDAMRLVREFDPAGERTLGVLTKLDLMDQGTDAREVLEGRALHLRHGWVGVVNRSQSDINANAKMGAARDKEKAFFRSRPEYGHLRCGTETMVTVLSAQLERAIRAAVPAIQAHIAASTRELEAQLRALGGDGALDRSQQLHTVLSLCDAFDRTFETMLDGGAGGGERVRAVFEGSLPAQLKALPFATLFSLKAVKRVIERADGIQPHLIAPELGMRKLIRDGVACMRPPCVAAADAVHDVLRDAVEEALVEVAREHPALLRYAALRATLRNTAEASIERLREEARKAAAMLVDMEGAYLSAEFFRSAQAQVAQEAAAAAAAAAADDGPSRASSLGSLASAAAAKLPTLPRKAASGVDLEGYSAEEAPHLTRVAATCAAYVAAVCDTLKRSVPKAVVFTMILPAKKSLLAPVYQQVGGVGGEQLEALLGEDPAAVAQRAACGQRLALLRRAREEVAAALM